MPRRRKLLFWLIPFALLLAAFAIPSFRADVNLPSHRHCIKQTGMALLDYASSNGGRFPEHKAGYGDALLLAANVENCHALTGPGYDPAHFRDALAAGKPLPEMLCGRVYVQGLTVNTQGELVVMFDKRSTPGGDHTTWPIRLWSSRGREVLYRDGSMRFIRDPDWPAFAEEQTEMLVRAGLPRTEVERLFAQASP